MIEEKIRSSAYGGAPTSLNANDFTPRTKRVLRSAVTISARVGSSYVGTEHLLIALVSDSDSYAVSFLNDAGVSISSLVEQVQKALGLECPQSIYRWLSGQALPSVENLYTLHRLLGCHMEDLLLTKDRPLRMRCAAYMIAI